MILKDCEILRHRQINATCYLLALGVSGDYARARPGQFVMLRVSKGVAPLLRRPFSIHRRYRQTDGRWVIEILYKVVGEGTGLLSQWRPGQRLGVLGPLGRGFNTAMPLDRVYMVAGGIGVAPMRFLSDVLAASDRSPRLRLFLGAQTDDDLLCVEDFIELGVTVTVTTDDGSAGNQCLVTDPFEQAVRQRAPDMVYACGPVAMLRCATGVADALGIACEVSVEALMACGMGACLGCAVAATDPAGGYLHACRDGPVFPSGAVVL
jgi:dihydroorotate dehydrogenase electron transfer subunit